MAFDLEKRIMELWKHRASDGWNEKFVGIGRVDFCELVRSLAAEVRADENKSKWIPVSERLPEDGTRVLARSNGEWWIARHKEGRWWDDGDYEPFHSVKITHWQPLPAAPSAGDGQ